MSVIRRYLPSHGERGLWFLQGLAPKSAAYNAMSTWRIQSPVDVGALQRAWASLTQRHDSIRTTYRVLHGALVAEVGDRGEDLLLVDANEWTPRS